MCRVGYSWWNKWLLVVGLSDADFTGKVYWFSFCWHHSESNFGKYSIHSPLCHMRIMELKWLLYSPGLGVVTRLMWTLWRIQYLSSRVHTHIHTPSFLQTDTDRPWPDSFESCLWPFSHLNFSFCPIFTGTLWDQQNDSMN